MLKEVFNERYPKLFIGYKYYIDLKKHIQGYFLFIGITTSGNITMYNMLWEPKHGSKFDI